MREYIYWDNQQIAMMNNALLYFVHNDHLNTPQVVTNVNQQVSWIGNYEPFGKLAANQTNTVEIFSRFPGQYLDQDTGLYYNYFRDYDPSIGRYIESDPIGLEGGVNTYAYVLNNPVVYTDPEGLAAMCEKTSGYRHVFVCSNSGFCAGLMPQGTSSWELLMDGPGIVLPETYDEKICKNEDAPEKCDAQIFEKCIEDKTKNVPAKENYGFVTHNCIDWANETIDSCKVQACAGK